MASLVRARGAIALVPLVALAACGGGDDEEGEGGGGRALEVVIGDPQGGLVDVHDVSCRQVDDQLVAAGIVENRGDNPHYVSISVRFVDGDGVRVELVSDSVNDLETSESARWDVTVYSTSADSVSTCDVVAEVS